jgi:serine/threonine protein phosphatase PrpC
MKYSVAQHSLIGARQENQDRIAVVERDNAVLLIVADGLGGYAGGGFAAETLVQTIAKSFQKVKQPFAEHPVIGQPAEFLALSILNAHKVINARAKAFKKLSPRTTCVACLIQNGFAYWAHVGDSRLYHFRDDRVISRTIDHTTTEQLRQEGVWDSKKQSSAKLKSHLLKCVGGPHRPRVTLGEETRLMPGDTIFLCSDGVWGAFNNDQIAEYLQSDSLDDALEEMLYDAEGIMKQACDNLSAIAFRWDDAITTGKPLQPEPVGDLDQELLWQEAKRKALHRRMQRQQEQSQPENQSAPPAESRKNSETIQSIIEELESFMDELDKSP